MGNAFYTTAPFPTTTDWKCVAPCAECEWKWPTQPKDAVITSLTFLATPVGGLWSFIGAGMNSVAGLLSEPQIASRGLQPDKQVGNTITSSKAMEYKVRDFTTKAPSSTHVVSRIKYAFHTCGNSYGAYDLRISWLDLKTNTSTDFLPLVEGQWDTTADAAQRPQCYCGAATLGMEGGIMQGVNMRWGPGAADGLFSFGDAKIFNLPVFLTYVLAGDTTLLLQGGALSITSEFGTLAGGFYRDKVVNAICFPPIVGAPVPKICWCMRPDFAPIDSTNTIGIDRVLVEKGLKGEVKATEPAVCWTADCKDAGRVYLHTGSETCDHKAVEVDLCVTNVSAFSDVKVGVDIKNLAAVLRTKCQFNRNRPPPGCTSADVSPICGYFLTDCLLPENKNKPECGATPAIDCSLPENKNRPECNLPPVIDCSLPENKGKPECKTPSPTPTVDCRLPENRNRPECKVPPTPPKVNCDLPENADKEECQSFFSKYKWWILAAVIGVILLIATIVIAATSGGGEEKKKKPKTST